MELQQPDPPERLLPEQASFKPNRHERRKMKHDAKVIARISAASYKEFAYRSALAKLKSEYQAAALLASLLEEEE